MTTALSGKIISVLFEYDTSMVVHIKSKTVGIINRLIQLLIISYVIGYVLIFKKGYQEFSTINSAATTKLKGVVYTNLTEGDFVADLVEYIPNIEIYNRIWDVADYVVPPQENGAFFVMTNAIITPNQTQTVCSEALIDGAVCNDTTAKDVCKVGTSLPNGNGVMTGKCVNDSYMRPDIKTCEVRAWCPVEYDELPTKKPLLLGSATFTVLIKNSIEFPLWNAKTRNILDTANTSYLTSCQYNSDKDPTCPIFHLGTIVKEAGEDYTKLAAKGGVMGIIIHWDCNLDFNVQNCFPTYSFRRLDNPDAKLAKGWNFRYANYFDNGNSRTLFKAYGILFEIFVEGRGGKFSIVPLLTNLGAGLALLSIAVVVCDVIVLYVMKKRDFYKEKKFVVVDDDDQTMGGNKALGIDAPRSRSQYTSFKDNLDH